MRKPQDFSLHARLRLQVFSGVGRESMTSVVALHLGHLTWKVPLRSALGLTRPFDGASLPVLLAVLKPV